MRCGAKRVAAFRSFYDLFTAAPLSARPLRVSTTAFLRAIYLLCDQLVGNRSRFSISRSYNDRVRYEGVRNVKLVF